MAIFLNCSSKEHTHILLKLDPWAFPIFYCVLSGSCDSVGNFFLELLALFQLPTSEHVSLYVLHAGFPLFALYLDQVFPRVLPDLPLF